MYPPKKMKGGFILTVSDKLRACAEFAKEAMDGQSINGATIGVKWANEVQFLFSISNVLTEELGS